eukprot:g389.t1
MSKTEEVEELTKNSGSKSDDISFEKVENNGTGVESKCEDGESCKAIPTKDKPRQHDEAKQHADESSDAIAKEKKHSDEQMQKKLWACPHPTTEEELRQAIESIKGNKFLPGPPKPKLPRISNKLSNRKKIAILQKYINSFEYNHTGTRYFRVNKHSMSRLTSTAKQIMSQALPIQCLEACVLACFITAWMKDVERVPLSFKSRVGNTSYRHIVLAIKCKVTNKWGALGLSRKKTLAYKSLDFETLGDLVLDFKTSYEACWHTLSKIYIGFPFPHDLFFSLPLHWRVVRIRVSSNPWDRVYKALNCFDGEMVELMTRFYRFGKHCADFEEKYGGTLGSTTNMTREKNKIDPAAADDDVCDDEDVESSDFESCSPRRCRDRVAKKFASRQRPLTSHAAMSSGMRRSKTEPTKRSVVPVSLPPLKREDAQGVSKSPLIQQHARPKTAMNARTLKRRDNRGSDPVVALKSPASSNAEVDSSGIPSSLTTLDTMREGLDEATTEMPPTPQIISTRMIQRSFLGV